MYRRFRVRLFGELLENRFCLSTVAFIEHEVVATDAVVPRDALVTDLDGDGDGDILFAAYSNRTIAWYANSDGAGSFESLRIISTTADGAIAIAAADLDGDGDPDVLSASTSDNKIAWYENRDGLGNFSSPNVITSRARKARDVYAADLDGDGDLDVLSASSDDHTIAWYENINGLGGFSEPRVLSRQATGAWAVHAADLDGDGDLDVLSAASGDSQISWFQNLDSAGNFGERKLIDNVDGATSVSAADVDGDGDIDVLSGAFSRVSWHENTDGSGSFSTHTIDSRSAVSTSVDAFDIDQDGDLDVVAASVFDNRVNWFENTDEHGEFSAKHVVTRSAIEVWSATAGDVDGDGDIDLVSTSGYEHKIAWYQNDGRGRFGNQRVVSVVAQGTRQVRTVDVDGDLDFDIVSTADFGIGFEFAWYENLDGAGSFGPQQPFVTDPNDPTPGHGGSSIHPVDFDGDGDMDLLLASSHLLEVWWHENTGGDFGGKRTVVRLQHQGDHGLAVDVADLDDDGDLDVLFAIVDGRMGWLENAGDTDRFRMHDFDVQSNFGAPTILAGDIDADGDLDIVASLDSNAPEGTIVWFENQNGRADFGPRQILTHERARDLRMIDLDGDFDLDLVTASYTTAEVAWFENLDGQGRVGDKRTIERRRGHALLVGDVDGNGTLDVLSTADDVVWHRHVDGRGDFATGRTVGREVSSSDLRDLDGDGDKDLLFGTGTRSSQRIAWFENRLVGDSNDDGVFDESDLVAVLSHGKFEDGIDHNANFDEGDWNQDLDFDAVDLVFAFQLGHYGRAAF